MTTPARPPAERPRLDPPKVVRKIASTLEEAGYETWCVGGAVRDALLGLTHLDWDLATAATPERVQSLFRHTKPIGIKFGTVGVLDRHGVMHEVTTFRRDVRTDGRHAVVEYGVSLDDDLARRDFTINAIAYSPRTGVVHDPFGGRADLERGLVRAVGDPSARLREDRLRALRAIRFAGRFGFEIEASTWRAIAESAPHLTRLSAERVRQELEKTMEQVRRPSQALALWRRSGALAVLVPDLGDLPDVVFRAADEIALPDATRREELAVSRRQNRLTTLFLDIDPAATRRVLRALRFSNRETEWIAHTIACWRAIGPAMAEGLAAGGSVPDVQLRRWVAQVRRTSVRDFFRVVAARWKADRAFGRAVPGAAAVASAFRRAVRVAYRDPIELADLAVNGEDLDEAGVPRGPQVGRMLQHLLSAVLEDPSLNRREVLLERARALQPGGATGAGEA